MINTLDIPSAHLVHGLEEEFWRVERRAVVVYGGVEARPLRLHVVHLGADATWVAVLVAQHHVGRRDEASHVRLDQLHRLLEVLERLRRHDDRRQRVAVAAAASVHLPLKLVQLAVDLTTQNKIHQKINTFFK